MAMAVDQKPSRIFHYFQKPKNQLEKNIAGLIEELESKGFPVKFIRMDNGGENKALIELCRMKGIVAEVTPPHTPQYNGVVERKFATIKNCSTSCMSVAGLEDETRGALWAHAMDDNCIVHNVMPHNGYPNCYEPFNEKAPVKMEDLLPWGTMGEMKIPGKQRTFKDKSEPVRRVGYDLNHPSDCYLVQKISNKQVVSTRDVIWATKYRVGKRIVQFIPVTKDVMTKDVEAEPLLNPDAHVIPDDDDPEIIPDDDDDDESVVGWNPVAGGAMPNQNPGLPAAVVVTNATAGQNPNTQVIPPTTGGVASPGRVRTGGLSAVDKQMRRLQIDMTDMPVKTVQQTTPNEIATAVYESEEGHHTEQEDTTECVFNVSVNSDPGDPNSTAEAMKSPEWKHWREGIFDEYDNFTKRSAWEGTPRPKGRKVLRTKNVYKRKLFAITKLLRYKVRNCVLGDKQIPGVDYTESYAAVVADQTIRTALGISLFYKFQGMSNAEALELIAALKEEAEEEWVLAEVLDVEAAFLNAMLEEEVYIEIPELYYEYCEARGIEPPPEGYVFKLKMGQYGLVQVARAWVKRFQWIITRDELGMKQCKTDPCLFVKHDKNNTLILWAVTYIDDVV
jgi:hypothetical protein